nr:SAP domain-containing protein [Desulfobulbaceae bacterium]
MKMTEIKTIAKNIGVAPGKLKKNELIHAIQSKEGNVACFQTGITICDQYQCCWRGDCLPE